MSNYIRAINEDFGENTEVIRKDKDKRDIDKRDIDKTLDILLSVKTVLDGLKDEDTYCDAIDVAMLWLERMAKENQK